MPSKYGSFSTELLTAIGGATGFFTWPIEGSREWAFRELRKAKKSRISDKIYRFKKRGLVKQSSKGGKKYYTLTLKGRLELLLEKASIVASKAWDGYWRIVIFDIPEECRGRRALLRQLLRRNGFVKLQASVFISPYTWNREAIEYLKQTGLNQYIRVICAREIDDDRELKKRFGLK